MSQAPSAAPEQSAPAAVTDETAQVGNLYIREYRVRGSKILKPIEIEEAVYPYMGPGRTEQDVEQARAALEKVYKDKGYQTVYVQVPQQTGRGGIIILETVEAPVGRLRVHGTKYFLSSQIKKQAQSMAEGTVPNFNEVSKDIMALNRWRDRKVTPSLKAGVVPGTVDIDLNVEDRLPFHGSLELNNRYNSDTTPLRLNGSLSYSNLWQAGHTLGLSFQIAPERLDDATVFSGYYLAPIPAVDGLSLMLTGTLQDSDVSTIGGAAVAGRGQVLGVRAMMTLPADSGFFHSLSFGMDYKKFEEDVTAAGALIQSPVEYYPFSLSYSASHSGKKSFTELNAALVFHLSNMGGSQSEMATKRFGARDNFFYIRADVSHTQDLPGNFQVFAKVQGQAADSALINTEQISGGGLNTVRGYLEATALGDTGIFGSLEFRTPSLIGGGREDRANEWRFYAFVEGGRLILNDPLPGQIEAFDLASIGIGSRIRFRDHFTGSLDVGLPLIEQANGMANDVTLTFRLGMEF